MTIGMVNVLRIFNMYFFVFNSQNNHTWTIHDAESIQQSATQYCRYACDVRHVK